MKKILILTFSLLMTLTSVFGQIYTVTNSAVSPWFPLTTDCVGSALAPWEMPPAGTFNEGLFEVNKGNFTEIHFSPALAGQTITVSTGSASLCANNVIIDGSAAPGVTLVFSDWSEVKVTGSGTVIKNLNLRMGNPDNKSPFMLESTADNTTFENCNFPNGSLILGYTETGNIHTVDGLVVNNCVMAFDLHIAGGSGHLIAGNTIGRHMITSNSQPIASEVTSNTFIYDNEVLNGQVLLWGSNVIVDTLTASGTGVFIEGEDNVLRNADIILTENPETSTNVFETHGNIVTVQNSVFSGKLITTGNLIEDITINVLPSVLIDGLNDINGIKLFNSSSSTTIKDSDISDAWNGILAEGSVDNFVENNHVHDNIDLGILIYNGANGNSISKNRIYNNRAIGVNVRLSTNNTVEDNFVFNNTFNGIVFQDNAVGSNNSATGNTVFGNPGEGIYLASSSSTAVNGNTIGLDTLGNVSSNGNGIKIEGGSSNNVGGVSGNNIVGSVNSGLIITGSNSNTIENNTFGGSTILQNGGNAILVDNGSSLNKIGEIGSGNVISNRTSISGAINVDGSSSARNTIVGNSTFCNNGEGISLTNGGNNSIITPTINRASSSVLTGSAPANSTIDIYVADTACTDACKADGSGGATTELLSQGKVHVATAITDGSGVWTYSGSALDYAAAIVTATDALGNTSEFSTCIYDAPCDIPENVTVVSTGASDFCTGASVELVSNSTSTALTLTYQWFLDGVKQTGETSNLLNATVGGNYTVVISDDKDTVLCNAPASIVITENTNNNVLTVNDATACALADDVALTATGGGATTTYVWTSVPSGNLTFNPNGNPSTVGTLTVSTGTVSTEVYEIDANGCESASASGTVTVIDVPTQPVLDGNTPVACSKTGETINIIGADPANFKYSWVIPASVSNIVSDADSSFLTVDFGTTSNISFYVTAISKVGGCSSPQSAAHTVALSGCGLNAEFTVDDACLGSTVTFTNESTGADSYEWTFDLLGVGAVTPGVSFDTNPVVNFTQAGIYTVKLVAISSGPPEVKDSIEHTIEIFDLPSAVDIIDGPTPVCEGEQFNYFVKPGDLNGTSSYAWFIDPSSTVEIANNNDNIDVLVGADDFQLKVVETDDNTCVGDTSFYNVTVNPLLANVGEITVPSRVCDAGSGETYTFTVAATNASGFVWTLQPDILDPSAGYGAIKIRDANGEIELDFGTYTGPMTLTVNVQDVAGCSSAQDVVKSVSFNVDEAIDVKIEIDSIMVCVGDDEFYFATEIPGANYTWIHNNVDTLNYDSDSTLVEDIQIDDSLRVVVTMPDDFCYNPLTSDTIGLYEPLDVINRPGADLWADQWVDGGRKNIEQQNVLVLSDVSDVYLYDNTTRIFADLAELLEFNSTHSYAITGVLKGAKQNGEDSVYFVEGPLSNPSLTEPYFDGMDNSPNQDTTWYTLFVNNSVCIDSSTVAVVLDFNIFIPNVFTPNGDGTYDTWEIKNIDQFPDNKVTVYNRWGTIVYDEAGYDNSSVVWKGDKDGEALPFGTYYYIVDLGNGADPFSGYVSIIK